MLCYFFLFFIFFGYLRPKQQSKEVLIDFNHLKIQLRFQVTLRSQEVTGYLIRSMF